MTEYKTTWREKICYGIGATGLDLSYGMFYSFLSYYLSSVLGLKESFLLILTPIARIWDGINDPMMGTIVDNTKTKFGKYRPWILIGTACNAIVLFLLFTKFDMSEPNLYVYVGVMYILWGMTNTMADIPYWSMVPSFTSDPKDRNLVSTVARTFSGLGQGIITVATPIILPILSESAGDEVTADKGYSAAGFSRWAAICAVLLVVFAWICVLSTKERNVVYGKKTKFSFKKIFSVITHNDQLVIFMIFAMLSNAGWYLTSGTAVYYFSDVLGEPTAQSKFSIIGAIGSVLGLFVIPVLSKWFDKRRIYQISLTITFLGYILMYVFGPVIGNSTLLNISYIFSSTGIASMFVSQTIFLADIVDYGEYKNGERNESITFSMKGFLQKMAYTIQTVILFGGLAVVDYSSQATAANPTFNDATKSAIGLICFGVPAILVALSFIVFTKKFKLHGELANKVHDYIVQSRANKSNE